MVMSAAQTDGKVTGDCVESNLSLPCCKRRQ